MSTATKRSTGDELDIELRKDVAGYRKRPDGGYDEIEFAQWILMVNGFQWGYVSKKTGSPISLIRRIDDATAAALREKVSAMVGERSPVTMPPQPPQDDEEIEDDDFDDDEDDQE